jgi:N6-adenosine-specific RNA methylase IME4
MTPWPFDGLEPHAASTVYVDAPWDHGNTQRLGGRDRRPAAAWRRYSTLTPTELAALPVGDLLGPSGHVWLTVTNGVLAAGLHRDVLAAWHARPITVLTWCKPGANGLGRYLRNSTEHVVLAVKGFGAVPDKPWPTTWLHSARTPHSQKPGAIGDIIEAVSPAPYVELFARQQRLGNWASWGLGHELTRQEPA